jgi:hypothetical protein
MALLAVAQCQFGLRILAAAIDDALAFLARPEAVELPAARHELSL